ncbi:flagellar assembly protein FliH [Gammaproteobacteria bacterium]
MSRVIAKEALVGTLRRWELPGIDDDNLFIPPTPKVSVFTPVATPLSLLSSPPPPSPSPPPVAESSQAHVEELPTEETVPVLPTAEEIEAISRAAYEEGFERGQQEGALQGFEQGHRDGLAQGLEEGLKQGIEQGIEQGKEQGVKQGFEQGLEQGKNEGVAQGLEEGRQEGLTQGFEQGHRDGLAQGDTEVQAKLERLGQLITLLDQPLADLDTEVEEQLVALAVAVARQIVRRELHLSPGEIVPVVREALASLPVARRNLRIFLHPDDISLVRTALGTGEPEHGMRLVEDAAITCGGCRVETEASRIDATVEHRINRVIARLLGGERESD